jgi:hypothetical protein
MGTYYTLYTMLHCTSRITLVSGHCVIFTLHFNHLVPAKCARCGKWGHCNKGLSRIRILLSPYKNTKKNVDSSNFVLFFIFLSLKNDVNVASKSHKDKKLC